MSNDSSTVSLKINGDGSLSSLLDQARNRLDKLRSSAKGLGTDLTGVESNVQAVGRAASSVQAFSTMRKQLDEARNTLGEMQQRAQKAAAAFREQATEAARLRSAGLDGFAADADKAARTLQSSFERAQKAVRDAKGEVLKTSQALSAARTQLQGAGLTGAGGQLKVRADVRKALSDIAELEKRAARPVDKPVNFRHRDIGAGVDSISAGLSRLTSFGGAALGLGVGAAGIQQIAQLADSYGLLQARLRTVSSSEAEFIARQAQLRTVAQENGQAQESVVQLYVRTADAVRGLTGDTADAVKLTDLVSKAMRISGASAEEAAGTTTQLAQALASGVLRGDEFNSVNEQAPRLMRALADGLKVSQGALRNMANEGKLTADVVLPALLSQMENIRKEAANLPNTFEQSMARVKNALSEGLGKSIIVNGGLQVLEGAANAAASHPDALGAAGDLAAITAFGIGAGKVFTIIQRLVSAAGGLRLAFTAFGAVVGGPWVLGITAAAAATYGLFRLLKSDGPASMQATSDASTELQAKITALDAKIQGGDYKQSDLTQGLAELQAGLRGAAAEATELAKALDLAPGDVQATALYQAAMARQRYYAVKINQLGSLSAGEQLTSFLTQFQSSDDKTQANLDKAKQLAASAGRTLTADEINRIKGVTRQQLQSVTDQRVSGNLSNVRRTISSGRSAQSAAVDLGVATGDIDAAAAAEQKAQLERNALTSERDALSKALGSGGISDTLRERLKSELDQVNDQLEQNAQQRAVALAELERRGADERLQIQIETDQALGNQTAAANAELERQYQAHLKTLRDAGVSNARELADAWREAASKRSSFEQLSTGAGSQVSALRSQWDSLSQSVQAGTMSTTEAQARFRLALDAARPQLQQQLEQLRLLAEQLGPEAGAQVDDLARSIQDLSLNARGPIQQLADQWQDLTGRMQQAAASWLDDTSSAISDMVLKGRADFKALADSIIADLIRIQVQKAMASAIGASGSLLGSLPLFGGSGGSAGAGTPAATPVAGTMYAAAGGYVDGPGTSTSDSVSAMLSRGEFVVPAARVRQYGLAMLERIRSGAFVQPRRWEHRYASGGLVGAAASLDRGAGSRPPVRIEQNWAIDARGADPASAAQMVRALQATKDAAKRELYDELRRGLI